MLALGLCVHPPSRESIPATPTSNSHIAIESIRVGDRVMGNYSPDEMSGDTKVDPATWRHLILKAEALWPDGTRDDINVETLQPPEWVQKNHAELGATVPIPLDLREMGMPEDLTAIVALNEPCSPIKPGPGRVVLTTVNHLNNDIHELTVASPTGEVETIRTTGLHRFYRTADKAWVSANELQRGDGLNGATGPLVVRGVSKLNGVHRVYNMTIESDHVYRVSLLGALVHNNCYINGKTPLPGSRGTGVARAAAAEVDLVRRTGKGTLDWTKTEIEYIQRTGELPDGIVGHHINSVSKYPEWAGDPRNVKFVRGQPEYLLEHGGNYRNPTTGPLIDRSAM